MASLAWFLTSSQRASWRRPSPVQSEALVPPLIPGGKLLEFLHERDRKTAMCDGSLSDVVEFKGELVVIRASRY